MSDDAPDAADREGDLVAVEGTTGTVGGIDAAVVLLAAGKASVSPERLPALVERAATVLDDRRAAYRRRYERVHADEVREIFFADRNHWATLGDELGFAGAESDAVRRAHEEQLLHLGRDAGREAEFDHALEIRQPVVVELPPDEGT